MVGTPTLPPLPAQSPLGAPSGSLPSSPGGAMDIFGKSKNTSGESTGQGQSQSQNFSNTAATGSTDVAREWDPYIGGALGSLSGVEGETTIAPGLGYLAGSAAPVNYSTDVAPLLNPYAFSEIQSRFAAERPGIEYGASTIAGNNARNPYSDATSNALANYFRGVSTQQGAEAGQILGTSYQQALAAAEQQRQREAAAGTGYIGAGLGATGQVAGLVQAGNVGTKTAQQQQAEAEANQNWWQQQQYMQKQTEDPSPFGTALGIAGMVGSVLAAKDGGRIPAIRARYAGAGVVPGAVTPTASTANAAAPPPVASLPPWMTPQTPLSNPATSPTTGVAPMQPLAIPAAPTPGSAAATAPAPSPAGIMTPPPAPASTTPITPMPPSTATPTATPSSNTGGAPITPRVGTLAPTPAFGNLPASPNTYTAPALTTSITPYTGKPLTPGGAVTTAAAGSTGYGTPNTMAHGGAVEDHHRFADKVAHAFRAFHAMRKHAQDPGPDGRQHMQDGGGGWSTTVSTDDPTSTFGNDIVGGALNNPTGGVASGPSFAEKLAKGIGQFNKGQDDGKPMSGTNIPNMNAPPVVQAQFAPSILPRYAADGGAIDARPHYQDAGGVPPSGGGISSFFSPITNLFSPPSATPPADPSAPLRPGQTPPQDTVTALRSYGLPGSISPAQRFFRGLTQVEGPGGFNASGFGKELNAQDQRDIEAAKILQGYEEKRGSMLAPDAQGRVQPILEAQKATGNVITPSGAYAPSIAAQKLPAEIGQMQAAHTPAQIYTAGYQQAQKQYEATINEIESDRVAARVTGRHGQPGFTDADFEGRRARAKQIFDSMVSTLRGAYEAPPKMGAPGSAPPIARSRAEGALP